MKFKTSPAPHIRTRENTRLAMFDAILPLLFLYAMAYYHYGPRALMLGAVGVGVCWVSDVVCHLVQRRAPNPRDYSAIVTGLLLPLMMPASIPYHIVITAAVFAIAVAKHPFGGVGHNVFNPAAAGFCFAAICFSGSLFSYPANNTLLPVFGPVEAALETSPAFTLRLGGTPRLDTLDMLLGNYAGPMGATNILVMVACLLYLVIRRATRPALPLSFFATVALFAAWFPRADVSATQSVQLEMMSGLMLFAGVFLLADPVTTPKRTAARIVFGVMAGVMAMLYRFYGNLEEGVTFSLLLMNAFVWIMDMGVEQMARLVRRRKLEHRKNSKARA